MALVQFVHHVVDGLNEISQGWIAALFYTHIDKGRYWAMVYRYSWSNERPRAHLVKHVMYNPMNVECNDQSPQLWFQIATVANLPGGQAPFDVYLPLGLKGVNALRKQSYVDTVQLLSDSLHHDHGVWTQSAAPKVDRFLHDHCRQRVDIGVLPPLRDNAESVISCVEFILHRSHPLPYH